MVCGPLGVDTAGAGVPEYPAAAYVLVNDADLIVIPQISLELIFPLTFKTFLTYYITLFFITCFNFIYKEFSNTETFDFCFVFRCVVLSCLSQYHTQNSFFFY